MGFQFLLKRRQRRLRRAVVHFLEMVGLTAMSGVEFSAAWFQSLKTGADCASELTGWLTDPNGQNRLMPVLERLSDSFPDPSIRAWWGVILELYRQKSGLGETTLQMAKVLREVQAREAELFLRRLPFRLNLTLILFFLPAYLAALVIPLLVEFTNSF